MPAFSPHVGTNSSLTFCRISQSKGWNNNLGQCQIGAVGTHAPYRERPEPTAVPGPGQKVDSSVCNCSSGRPTTLENDPEISRTINSPCSWIAYAPALSSG